MELLLNAVRGGWDQLDPRSGDYNLEVAAAIFQDFLTLVLGSGFGDRGSGIGYPFFGQPQPLFSNSVGICRSLRMRPFTIVSSTIRGTSAKVTRPYHMAWG